MAMAIMYPRGHAPDTSTCAVMGIICGNMNCSSFPSMDKENFPGANERGEELMKALDTKVYKECVYLGTLADGPRNPSIYRKFGFVHETIVKMLDPTEAENDLD